MGFTYWQADRSEYVVLHPDRVAGYWFGWSPTGRPVRANVRHDGRVIQVDLASGHGDMALFVERFGEGKRQPDLERDPHRTDTG